MTILVLTATTVRDDGIDSVARELEKRGERLIRLESDRYPTEIQLTTEIGLTTRHRLITERETVDLADISAVWVRHTDTAARLPDNMVAEHRQAAQLQSDIAVQALLQSLTGVFMLDPPASLDRVPHKPGQLILAQEIGLDVPRTMVSNDPAAVRAFAQSCPTGVMAKLIDSASISIEYDGRSEPIYTWELTEEDLAELHSLQFSPMLFQERVLKTLELRVTIVGEQLFVAAVDSNLSTEGQDDWRQDRQLVDRFQVYDRLPPIVGEQLLALTRQLGLNFATVDLILTPDGRYVFLELNTISYFDFIEQATGLPISAAIAELLIRQGKPSPG